MAYDDIIVGGGSAGCVLAARLSQHQRRRVLLIEAGPDYPNITDLPPDIADASQPSVTHDWGYSAEPDEQGRSIPLPRAKLIGGCSATNSTFLVRPWPADLDHWADLGNPGWSFAELLPIMQAMESDADFEDEWHGTDGPVPVHRRARAERTALHQAFIESAAAVGHPLIDDHNRPGSVGVGPMPRNVRDDLRMSAAITHLAQARTRANLTVRPRSMVDRVEWSGTRARGIRLLGGEILECDRVVLAAGAYGSPAILMRSGVGSAVSLTGLGIDPIADLSGVGDNLHDHPLVAVDLPTSSGGHGPRFQVLLTMRSSSAASDAPPDLHLFAAGPFDDSASPSGGVFGIVTGLMAPSSRGSVRLRSADPSERPRIDVAHLKRPDDLSRTVEATQEARRISRASPLRGFIRGKELAPGFDIRDDDIDGLARSIRARVGTYHHPVGTCAMGPSSAAGAVVNGRGKVHAVDGVWVADASVMPTIPSANTNLATMLLAERIAQWLVNA